MIDNKNSFIKGTILLTLSAIILKIIGVIYKIPLSYILGDEGMGYFNSAYTVYVFFYIIGNAGIPRAITILISKSEAERKNNSCAIRNQALLFFSAFSLILFLLLCLLTNTFSSFISNEKAIPSMLAIAPSIIFVSCGGVLRGYYGGRLKFSVMAISEIISGLGKLFVGLALAYYSAGKNLPTHIISAYTISGITIGTFFSLIFLILFVKKDDYHTPIFKDFFKTIKSIVRIAFPITLASAISGITSIFDLILIMRGLVKNGYTSEISNILYGNYTTLALPMFTLLSTLITQISTALVPNLTRYHSEKNKTLFINEANKALKLTYFIIIPSSFMFMFFPYDILGLLFDGGSVSLGYVLLILLAPSILILGPLTIINTVLESTGKISLSVISLISGAITKLLINGILINFTNLHIYSAPISTLASYLVSLIISYFFVKKDKELNIDYMSSAKNYILPSICSVFLGVIFRNFVIKVELNKAKTTILLLIMGGVYLILSLLLSKKARKSLRDFVKTNKN